MDNRTFRLNEPQVVADAIDGEVLAINMATGAYFNLQGWSAFTWAHLTAGATVAATANTLAGLIGDLDTTVVASFADELVDHGLVVPTGHADTGSPTHTSGGQTSDELASDELASDGLASDGLTTPVMPPPSIPFDGLGVQAHTDMADLILLDPVHDVDPNHGWPQPPTPR